jgi:hypothetical protein
VKILLSRKLSKLPLILIAGVFIAGLCALILFFLFGSGLAFWFVTGEESVSVKVTPRLIRQVEALSWSTPTATPTSTATSVPSPTLTSTATPVETATPLPTVSPTPLPTASPTPLPTDPPRLPDTPTPIPTDTATPAPPAYPFIIKESAQFPTNHFNFDIYIAIVNDDNRPLSDYRVIGVHSSGLQITSPISAGDWIVNSGAMHYKAGNVKYEAPNSPTGTWTLQLVDGGNTPVAPPVEFTFDTASPTWYFLIYERQE